MQKEQKRKQKVHIGGYKVKQNPIKQPQSNQRQELAHFRKKAQAKKPNRQQPDRSKYKSETNAAHKKENLMRTIP